MISLIHYRSRPLLLALFILLLVLPLSVFFYRLHNFIGRVFFTHSGIAVTQQDLARYDPELPQVVPKIIHQIYHDWTWHNGSMPLDWEETRRTCEEMNEGWEFVLWNENTSRSLIETHYSWFLHTYDGYRHPIQRVDAVRYFIIRHHGGIYIDLDNGCLRPLTPLLTHPVWTTDGARGALSNNILVGTRQHPFWVLLTDSLQCYNYDYILPYVTISWASGQWFLTEVWEAWHAGVAEDAASEVMGRVSRTSRGTGILAREAQTPPRQPLHRLMMDNRPSAPPWLFFTQRRGGTWEGWDNRMFLWLGQDSHALLLGVGIGLGIVLVCWSCKGKGKGKRAGRRMEKATNDDVDVSQRERLLEQEEQGRRDV